MAEIKGTNVASPVVPFTTEDIYATHEAKYGKGGFRSVSNLTELHSIPTLRLEEGMVVYVLDDPSGIHNYQYLGGNWVRSRTSQGIPVYTQELIDELGINPPKDSYVSIPSSTDINGEVEHNTFTTTENGTYIDILFKALRALQSEVAKLKNSFEYGIESYTGTTTAMSSITQDLKTEEEEPLWAIMEDNLSEVTKISLGEGHPFKPEEDAIIVIDPDTSYSYIKFDNKVCTWNADNDVLSAIDSKLYLYLTSKNRSIKVNLEVFGSDKLPVNHRKYYRTIDLSKITLKKTTENNAYNTLIVVSRKQRMSDGIFYGKNFIWISISDPSTNEVLIEGYWKDGNIYSSPVILEDDYKYCFESINFQNVELVKFKLYSKWQDFSHEVIPSQPSEQDYKFKAAHITIRSVDTQGTLESVKNQILNNELIFVEDTKRLWIKTNDKLTIIAGGGGSEGGGENTGMTKEEMIDALRLMGIVQESNGDLKISNLTLDDVTFIHQATGKRFRFSINSSGDMVSQELADPSTKFSTIINQHKFKLTEDVRGFIGNLNGLLYQSSRGNDYKLYSDRLKIGSFYAPLESDIVHGCSHAYVELENTSDKDINLEGCYLHYTRPLKSTLEQVTYHLPLTGKISAGGTYLIRGKQYSEFNDSNTYLKVKTFDQEWFIHPSEGVTDLIDFEVLNATNLDNNNGYGFALTYGNNFGGTDKEPKPLSERFELVRASTETDSVGSSERGDIFTLDTKLIKDFPYIFNPFFIDSIYYNKSVINSSNSGYWSDGQVNLISNSIYRNTFELDPAKQAFQAFTKKDSSRVRWSNNDKDAQIISLDKEYISYPHTEEIYKISNYTPRASFENKNVCTDKTKLNPDKPNMVTSSFGIDVYKTRCFNWISIGYFPEYIWIKKEGDLGWSRHQSYLPIHGVKLVKVEEITTGDGNDIATTTNIIFNITTPGWIKGSNIVGYSILANENHKKILDATISYSVEDSGYKIVLPGSNSALFDTSKKYYLYQKTDETFEDTITYPKKKYFDEKITNCVYARITGRFPASNEFYTAHKVIIDIVNKNVSSPTKYKYIVGRADKKGNPDPLHTSEELSFTLYPETYKPRVYQITDQQGFTWSEYQVWAAVANKLNEKINKDIQKSNIIPVLINTGDMTQNGTRINEWYDYYIAGGSLFNHLEQMNVVGNNDLCGPDPEILGTGDDSGKSNSFYFHVFYCYEVGNTLDGNKFEPIIIDQNIPEGKYIPSTYYFDFKNYRFLMVNSEITETTCKTWFKKLVTIADGSGSESEVPVNIYTGYSINGDNNQYIGDFTTIYTMLWRILRNAKTLNKEVVAVCHEMPFTVITNDSLSNIKEVTSLSRSLSNAKKLIGSHTNQISANEVVTTKSPKGTYWFSRLLEYYKVKLVLGGHKHTYSCTYPVRENYYYLLNGVRTSSESKPMDMLETLEGDSVNFIEPNGDSIKDLSKFPYVKRADIGSGSGSIFYPSVCKPNLVGGVVYFMCQASGYKLTSNKELPSPDQKFSRILPKTGKDGKKDKPSPEQKVPMFAVVDVLGNNQFSIKLARVKNIFTSDFKFDQYNFSKDNMSLEWLTEVVENNYGSWKASEEEIELFKVE